MTVAKINNKMMHWARHYAGFVNGYEEELPKSIRLNYKSWESGEKYPTWNQLRQVSRKYNVPTAFFFMEKPPNADAFPQLINYRKLDTSLSYSYNSPALIKSIRKSEVKREIYLELSDEMDRDIVMFRTLGSNLDKYDFARHIRKTLDVSFNLQKSWFRHDNFHYNFLNNWKEVLNEKMGILVFETEDVDIKEMRGLCIFHDETPIILLNGKDSVNGRIFSIFHELAHLLLGESAICDGDENRSAEVFCNSVAGEFLVPEKYLLAMSSQSLKSLTNAFGVSEEVISRRLFDLGIIDEVEYQKNISLKQPKILKSSGNYLNNMIKYNGRPYYSLLLSALDLNIISTSEFMKYSNLSKKHILKLQDKLFGAEI